jgi:hypothetical protein
MLLCSSCSRCSCCRLQDFVCFKRLSFVTPKGKTFSWNINILLRFFCRKMRVSLWEFIASNFSRGHYVILIIALLPLWAFILNNYYILIIALVFHRQTLPLFHQCVKVIEIIIHCWMRTKYEIRRMKRRVKTFFRKAKQVAKDVLQGIILVSIFLWLLNQ